MRRALAAAAVLALALVGCTDGGQSPTSTTSSPPPTGQTSTTPTSTTSDPATSRPPSPTPPSPRPPPAPKPSSAHYADVLNYAASTQNHGAAQKPRHAGLRGLSVP